MSTGTHPAATTSTPQTGRLGWVIVYVPSVEQALAFYERAFGLARKFLHDSGSFGELDTGATTLAFASEELGDSHFEGGFQHASPAAPPYNVEMCLVFDDVASAYERAVGAGASPLAPPEVKPWGQTVAYVRDVFGTLVELASPIG
jgi:lactoylglutathione lyase